MLDEQNLDNGQQNQNTEESINLYALFFKYFIYWPWFVASVVICLIACFIYLRYQAPVYNVSSAVLIKEDDSRNTNTSSPLAAVQDLGMFSMTNNFDNEVEILKSRTLARRVVNKLKLYISVGEKRFFGYNTPLYKNSPINVYITPEEAEKLEAGAKLDINYTLDGKLNVQVEYTLEEEEESIEQTFDQIPAVFPTPLSGLRQQPHRCSQQLCGKHLHRACFQNYNHRLDESADQKQAIRH